MKYILVLLLALSFRITELFAKDVIPERTDRNGYVEPFKMFDNVFYVGDKWASSYLIKTTDGLVLIETLESPFGRWIPGSVEKLGFNPSDIKYILITHGHSDHVGNAEYIQRLYGGQVVMSREEFLLAQEQSKKSRDNGYFKAPRVSIFPEDGDKLMVGDTEFTFYITPGHTEGCMSIDFMVKESGELHRAFMVGGHSPPNQNLDLINTFIESIERIRTLSLIEPKVSVNLANHPHKNMLFEKNVFRKKGREVNNFIDGKSFFEFLDKQEQLGRNTIAELRANAASDIAR